MKKALGVSLFLACGILLSTNDIRACGDKFPLIGRVIKYQHAYVAAHPARILFYKSSPAMASAARDIQLETILTAAGHKLQIVRDAGSLEAALRSQPYDIVLGDPADAAAIERIDSGRARPVFVPILYNPTKVSLASAERQYSTFLKAPDKSRHPLSVIDDALKVKAKGATVKSS